MSCTISYKCFVCLFYLLYLSIVCACPSVCASIIAAGVEQTKEPRFSESWCLPPDGHVCRTCKRIVKGTPLQLTHFSSATSHLHESQIVQARITVKGYMNNVKSLYHCFLGYCMQSPTMAFKWRSLTLTGLPEKRYNIKMNRAICSDLLKMNEKKQI